MKFTLKLLLAIIGVFAVSLALFYAVYGAFIVFNKGQVLTFNFEKSSDLASWIQAVGSIAAIVGSYFIGARQARDAKDAALELYQLDRRRTEEGCCAIVQQMTGAIATLKTKSLEYEASGFRTAWQSNLKSMVDSALQRFDSMPIHEIGNREAIQVAYEIRAEATRWVQRIDKIIINELTPPPAVARGTKTARRDFDNTIDGPKSELRAQLRATIKDCETAANSLYARFESALVR